MPTYTYKCTNNECWAFDEYFEVVQKITDEPLKHCPECQHESLQKVLGNTQVIFKGEGWPTNEGKGIVHYDPKTYKKPR